MSWTGLKIVRMPPNRNKKLSPSNPFTVEINNMLHTVSSLELYDRLMQCRSDEQRIAAITAWRLTHGET